MKTRLLTLPLCVLSASLCFAGNKKNSALYQSSVNPLTGELRLKENELPTPHPLFQLFQRSYSHLNRHVGFWGVGRCSSIEKRLYIESENRIQLSECQGLRTVALLKNGVTRFQAVEENIEIAKTKKSYFLKTKQGLYRFNSEGVLDQFQQAAHLPKYNIVYQANKPVEVTDSDGKPLVKLSWSMGLISEMQVDSVNTKYEYTRSFLSVIRSAIATVTQFEYRDQLLRMVLLPNGKQESYDYDAQSKFAVTKQAHCLQLFSYDDSSKLRMKTTMIERCPNRPGRRLQLNAFYQKDKQGQMFLTSARIQKEVLPISQRNVAGGF